MSGPQRGRVAVQSIEVLLGGSNTRHRRLDHLGGVRLEIGKCGRDPLVEIIERVLQPLNRLEAAAQADDLGRVRSGRVGSAPQSDLQFVARAMSTELVDRTHQRGAVRCGLEQRRLDGRQPHSDRGIVGAGQHQSPRLIEALPPWRFGLAFAPTQDHVTTLPGVEPKPTLGAVMEAPVPNHHAHHPGFSGWEGLKAAVRFLKVGTDAGVACDLVGIGPGDHLVDIGSGPGVAVREAVRRGATAVAVDPAEVMIEVGKRRNDHPSIQWRTGAAEALPVEDSSATVVWSMATVHHWQDVDAGLTEVGRVLQPGGRFLAIERYLRGDGTDITDHGWLESQAEVFMTACAAHGLGDVRLTTSQASRGKLLCVLATKA